jgi:hypothetical protein
MRLCIMSDLHLEYEWRGRFALEHSMGDGNPISPSLDSLGPVDLVVLAGDIDEGWAGIDYAMRVARRLACQVVYIPGNHEYYGYYLPSFRQTFRSRADADDVIVLDDRSIDIGGWTMLGSTLWTDYRLYGDAAHAMAAAEQGVEDHRFIHCDDGQMLTPQHAATLFDASRAWLGGKLLESDPDRTIVITHHAPLPDSIAPQFRGGALSPAFASDLSELIAGSQPALWVHGHTHHDIDIMVGRTRVVSRQRGYWGIEDVAAFTPLLIDLP